MAKIDTLEDDGAKDCIVFQGIAFTVPKNLLIRVEIHRSGTALGSGGTGKAATFKWSCINGSADLKISQIVISVETVGKDKDIKLDVAMVTFDSPLDSRHLSLEVGDMVEILDDTYILARQAFSLW
jgi:hypothetical protein